MAILLKLGFLKKLNITNLREWPTYYLTDLEADPNKGISENSQKLLESIQNSYQIQVYKGNSLFEEGKLNTELKKLKARHEKKGISRFEVKMLYEELKDLKARHEKMRGDTPNEKMRKYLRDCRQSIELAQAASEISECDWGLQYSLGLGCTLPKPTELRQLLFILRADALLLAADGDYRAALERCLMIRRFARHVGDDAVILYIMARAFDNSALKCIQFLLGNMKPDIDTVTWLKNQLSIKEKPELSHARTLKIDFGMALKSLHQEFSDVLRKQAEKNPVEKTLNLTDEDFIARGRWLYSNFLNSSLEVIDSNMPYSEKYTELQRLTEKLKKDAGFDPGAMVLIMGCADQVLNLYNIRVGHKAHVNAVKAGIEIYLIKAETGQLPKELLDGLPKDPYSGEDFEYEITEDGFALRSQSREYKGPRSQILEFKVQKPAG